MEDSINVLDYLRILLKYRRFIIVSVFLSTILSIVSVKRLPNIYQADATILPANQSGNASLLNSLGGGIGALLTDSEGTPSSGRSQLMTILSSRTLAETVINQNKNKILKALYPNMWDSQKNTWKTKDPKEIPPMLDMSAAFLSHLTFKEPLKSPTIIVKAEFQDPSLAADIVNIYITALTQYLNTNTLTNTKRNRSFIENSLEQKNKELLEAGKELAKFYETNVIAKVGSLTDVDVNLTTRSASKTTNIVKNVPQQIHLHYLAEQRSTLSAVTSMLATEYEKAKIAENKEDLTFQVIDWAQTPTHKIKPPRSKYVILSVMASLFISIFVSLLWEKIIREIKERGKQS